MDKAFPRGRAIIACPGNDCGSTHVFMETKGYSVAGPRGGLSVSPGATCPDCRQRYILIRGRKEKKGKGHPQGEDAYPLAPRYEPGVKQIGVVHERRVPPRTNPTCTGSSRRGAGSAGSNPSSTLNPCPASNPKRPGRHPGRAPRKRRHTNEQRRRGSENDNDNGGRRNRTHE